jgi:hypothetical protein
VVDRSVRRWTQTSPKNLNMDSSDDNAFVRIMYFLDEMVSTAVFKSLRCSCRSCRHEKCNFGICRWYYTSDVEIREVMVDEVLQSTAYMLFYEKTSNMSAF